MKVERIAECEARTRSPSVLIQALYHCTPISEWPLKTCFTVNECLISSQFSDANYYFYGFELMKNNVENIGPVKQKYLV